MKKPYLPESVQSGMADLHRPPALTCGNKATITHLKIWGDLKKIPCRFLLVISSFSLYVNFIRHGKVCPDHYKLEPHEIHKLDVKGKLEILKTDGSTQVIPLAELESCIRKGCHCCTDLTAVYADISACAIGSAPGSTTLLVRTPTGKGFVESAVQNRKLVLAGEPDTRAIEKLASAKIKKNTK